MVSKLFTYRFIFIPIVNYVPGNYGSEHNEKDEIKWNYEKGFFSKITFMTIR